MNLRALRFLLIALIAAEVTLWFLGPQPKDHLPDIEAASAAGKKPDWWDDAAMGVHRGAAIGGGIFLVLLITAPAWRRPMRGGPDREEMRVAKAPRYFWPLLVGASVLCLGLRLPMASKSLWWDEAWVIEQVSLGRWKPDSKEPEKMKFQAHDWTRCAWYYQKPTNHAPMSLLQKVSITLWQKVTHARKDQFSDLAARAPALLASCLAVLLLGLLLKTWGRPGAGVLAGFALAAHPWYVRYGVDARAYALVVPLCIAGMLAITRMVQTRGRKLGPWLGWGLVAFVWLWAYPNAVLDIAALNLAAAVFLWKEIRDRRDRWSSLFRLAAANAFAAICFIQAFLPNFVQARHWVGHEADKHVLDAGLAASTFSQLFWGRELWFEVNAAVFAGLSMAAVAVLVWFAGRRQPRVAWGLLAALCLSALGFATATWRFDSYFYSRFVIAMLPVLVALLCLRKMVVAAGVLVVGLAPFWMEPLHLYLTRPYQPLHDVATLVQNETRKAEKAPLVACYGLGREVMPVYYPSCLPVENLAGLTSMAEKAQREGRGLFVIQGYDTFNRAMLGDGFAVLDDRTRFEEVGTLQGIEPEFTFHVLREK